MDCPKCKHVSLAGSNFCEKCGYDLKAHTRQKPRAVDPYSYGPSTPSYPSAERYHGGPSSYGSHPTPSPAPAPAPRPAAAAPPPPQAPARPTPPPPVAEPPRPRRPGGQINTPAAPASSPSNYTPPPAASPVPFAHLESTDPNGPKFPLVYDRTEVGRLSAEDHIRPQVDLTACDRDGTVSRQHAIIYKEESFVVLEDRGSRNGTFVNGTRLESGQQFTLTNGAEVRFGTVSFRYRNSQ